MGGQTDVESDGWLTETDFKRVRRAAMRKAERALRAGSVKHRFHPSTDYDVVLADGTRLAPKALFGVAAGLTLGREVRPSHFRGGAGTRCFRALELAGYEIVPKKQGGNTLPTVEGSKLIGSASVSRERHLGASKILSTHANLESPRATAPLTRWLIDAAARRTTITYGYAKRRLENECGFGVIFGIAVGRVAGAAMNRILERSPEAPLLNVLLVQAGTALPGAGAVLHLAERYPDRGWLRMAGANNDKRWRDLIEEEATRVYSYLRWDDLYRDVYDESPQTPCHQSSGTERARVEYGKGGEGPNHKAMRLRVSREPGLVQKGLQADATHTEVELLSGDRVDVVSYAGNRTVAIEVKSLDSDWSDLRRGVYQCVKYRAVLSAQDIRLNPRIEAWLVTEDPLPRDLKELARRLGVRTKSLGPQASHVPVQG